MQRRRLPTAGPPSEARPLPPTAGHADVLREFKELLLHSLEGDLHALVLLGLGVAALHGGPLRRVLQGYLFSFQAYPSS